MQFDDLITKIESEPLSKVLPAVMRITYPINNTKLQQWLKLEMNGYFTPNPALTGDVTVPEYRTVSGQHSDDFGRRLEFEEGESNFVNTTILRYGVSDLECMFEKGGSFSIRDPHMCEFIKSKFKIEVTQFSFDSTQIGAVLSYIKTELSGRLMELKDKLDGAALANIDNPVREDIIELKPNFFGVGVNLNALGRKWKALFKKNA